ncbi:MAG: response regulator transcription factor [Bacteroidota bacterium]
MSETPIKILIVDDEPDILEFLRYNLEKEGYTVFTANNGNEAIEAAKRDVPDLIVLDVMMPGLDGVEVCRQLREIPQFATTIIIFLTARSEDYSEIAGFDVGADDYITKPIRPRVLIVRIKALLKRKRVFDYPENIIRVGNIMIDNEKRLIKKGNKVIKLPKKEFDLLLLLTSKPERFFTREEIYLKLWGSDLIVGDRTLDVHIRKLRERIGEKYIKTSKGVGYAFAF